MKYNEKVVIAVKGKNEKYITNKVFDRKEGSEMWHKIGGSSMAEMIDEPIFNICKILTDKGYKLNYSCSGHIDSECYKTKTDFRISIGFIKDYGFNYPIPHTINKGGMHHYETSCCYTSYFKTTIKDKDKAYKICVDKRNEWIKELEKWANELPEV
jgi:hypothetical protein